jgi:hypothetical protein
MANPTQADLDAFILRAGFTFGWLNLESSARRMAEKAVEELNERAPSAHVKACVLTALERATTILTDAAGGHLPPKEMLRGVITQLEFAQLALKGEVTLNTRKPKS